jgi:DNA-binding LacI/PurR family transcriptional regulator
VSLYTQQVSEQERAMSFPSRPTIHDIAREAGVSPAAVSYVLSNLKDRSNTLSEETASRIRSAMDALGYVITDRPTPVTRRRTDRVVLVVCRIGSLYSQMLAAHIERALAEHGLTLGVQEGDGPDDLKRAARLLEDNLIDGLIVETDDESVSALSHLGGAGLPVVAIGPKAAQWGSDVVTSDDTNAIREAMLHLVDHGYENFVLLSPRNDSNRDYHTTVARDQLRALGMRPDRIETAYSAHDPVAAFNAITPVLGKLPLPAAIVTGSDSSALGVLWACMRLGLEVPGDVAILGHGNSPQAGITTPPISTIGPDRSELRTAADLIASRIGDPAQTGRHVIEPWSFIPRGST